MRDSRILQTSVSFSATFRDCRNEVKEVAHKELNDTKRDGTVGLLPQSGTLRLMVVSYIGIINKCVHLMFINSYSDSMTSSASVKVNLLHFNFQCIVSRGKYHNG